MFRIRMVILVLCYRYSDLAINYTINKSRWNAVIKQDDVHGFVNKQ